MPEPIGEQIRAARELRGWDQAELSRRLALAGASANQQTISRWERGGTTPRSKAVLAALAQTLGIESAAIGPGAGVATESRPVPSARPLLTLLRFEDLTPEAFESLSADLASLLFPESTVSRAGTSGHKQYGIDVEVRHAEGLPTGIQCKREKQFGVKKVQKAVAELTIEVDTAIIFLSRIASPDARRELKNHPSWDIWDADDLSRKIRQLPRDQALRIVDTYFPGMRMSFLGIPTPGPWRDRTEFFAPTNGASIYSHRWPLIGRQHLLDDMADSISRSQSRLTTLSGRGGLGKTRLLSSLAERLEQEQCTTIFLARDQAVAAADFELLPNSPLIVIIDDAHDRPDLRMILGGIWNFRADAKVLLTLRPYGWPALLGVARAVAIHSTEITRFEVDDLTQADARRLAEIVLPAELSALAPHLAQIGADCPLLIVVGGGLIRAGKLDSSRLERSPELAEEILQAFGDALSVNSDGSVNNSRRDILKAIAIMQPFRFDIENFRTAIEELTGLRYEHISAEIGSLEEAGVLLRRGNALRVVPDLLGDAILAQAMFVRSTPTPTGYAERVETVVSGEVFDNALVNATRVDWRTLQNGEERSSAIDPLWAALRQDFEDNGIQRRIEVIRRLREIAQFQAQRCVALASWAIANPTADGADEYQFWAKRDDPYTAVLEELAPMLEIAGHDLGSLQSAADLLWSLGRCDPRPLNQNPDQPIRILSNLCTIQRYKSLAYSEILLDRVAEWLKEDLSETAYSPLEILKPLLATEGETQTSDGLKITFHPFAINPAAVAELRRRAIKLALSQLHHEDVRQAIRAVEFVEEGLHYPTGSFGREVSAEECSGWTPLIVESLEALGAAIADPVDPAVLVAVRFACNWHSKRGPDDPKKAASDVIARIPNTLEYRLSLSLHDGWDHLGRDLSNYEASGLRQRERFAELASELEELPAEEVVEQISARLFADRRGFTSRTGHPFPFLDVLLRQLPSVALQLCLAVEDDVHGPLADAVGDALASVAVTRPAEASRIAHSLRSKNNAGLDRQLAHALTIGRRGRTADFDGERELILELARSPDPLVRVVLCRGLRHIASPEYGDMAASTVSAIDFSDSKEVAEEVLGAFTERIGFLRWENIPPAVKSSIGDGIVTVPSIDDYSIMAFLSDRSGDDTEWSLGLLRARVEYSEGANPSYRPLPFSWHVPLRFRGSDRYPEILRSIRNWVAAGSESWRRRKYGADLFKAVSVEFDAEALAVIEEGVALGVVGQIEAVQEILAEAPRDLVWTETEYVVRLLRTADASDPEFARKVGGGLEAAVIFGAKSGVPGQPYAEDIELRDRSFAVAKSLAQGTIERRFYEALHSAGERAVERELTEDPLNGDGRRW